MSQVSGPVIAMGLVLSAVFVPCAFISGITGQFFRQFALTIAASTIISTFNSLTLSPALSAVLLRPRGKAGHEVLPKLLYVAAGGWLAWRILAPWLLAADRRPRCLAARARAPPGYGGPWVAAVGRARSPAACWAGREFRLGLGFAAFNAGFRLATRVYTRAVAWCCASARWCWWSTAGCSS